MFNKRNQNFDHLSFLNNFAIEFVPFMKYTIANLLTNHPAHPVFIINIQKTFAIIFINQNNFN